MALNGLSHQDVQAYMKAPGGKPNYQNPPNSLLVPEHIVNVLGIVLTTWFVAVRMYTRQFVLKSLWWDDYMKASVH